MALGAAAGFLTAKAIFEEAKKAQEIKERPEPVTKLTSYGKGVQRILDMEKSRIAFNPETGILWVEDGNGKVLLNKLKDEDVKSITVVLTPENYGIEFTYMYSDRGMKHSIGNLYGEELEVRWSPVE